MHTAGARREDALAITPGHVSAMWGVVSQSLQSIHPPHVRILEGFGTGVRFARFLLHSWRVLRVEEGRSRLPRKGLLDA